MTKPNPFKFGSVVDKPYFTNRVEELQQIKNLLQSKNHLILISPRRYGKTSLILKVVKTQERSYIFLDFQLVTDVADFATRLLKRLYRIYPVERIKQFIKNFRIGKGLDRQLRAIIQHHKNVNYAFLGSMESMMRDIFEKKNSAFYHFGQLITLDKIPYDDFYN